MQASAKPIEDVFASLSEALDDLDSHGEAMAALHLAMAVECLRASIDGGEGGAHLAASSRPQLRLVASS